MAAFLARRRAVSRAHDAPASEGDRGEAKSQVGTLTPDPAPAAELSNDTGVKAKPPAADISNIPGYKANKPQFTPGHLRARDLWASRRAFLVDRCIAGGLPDSQETRVTIDAAAEHSLSLANVRSPVALFVAILRGDDVDCVCVATKSGSENGCPCHGTGRISARLLLTDGDEDTGIRRRKDQEAAVAEALTGMRLGLTAPISEAYHELSPRSDTPVYSDDARELLRFVERNPGRSWRAVFGDSWAAAAKELGLVTTAPAEKRSAS